LVIDFIVIPRAGSIGSLFLFYFVSSTFDDFDKLEYLLLIFGIRTCLIFGFSSSNLSSRILLTSYLSCYLYQCLMLNFRNNEVLASVFVSKIVVVILIIIVLLSKLRYEGSVSLPNWVTSLTSSTI